MADRRLILKGAAALPPRELGNEPHTTDGYEQNRGIAPGKLVCDWVKEMAPYFKSLAPLQMITTGGARASFRSLPNRCSGRPSGSCRRPNLGGWARLGRGLGRGLWGAKNA